MKKKIIICVLSICVLFICVLFAHTLVYASTTSERGLSLSDIPIKPSSLNKEDDGISEKPVIPSSSTSNSKLTFDEELLSMKSKKDEILWSSTSSDLELLLYSDGKLVIQIPTGSTGVLENPQPIRTRIPAEYINVITTIVIDPNFSIYGSAHGLFSDMKMVKEFEFLGNLDVTNLTDSSYMFSGMSSLTYLNLKGWNTSKVENMSHMFTDTTLLNSIEWDNTLWNTSQVKDMSYMFDGAESLTHIDFKTWNTSQVRDMTSMFDRDKSLESLDLTSFDTSQVTSMAHMFYGMDNLNNIDTSSFNTSRVTDMYQMFELSVSLTSLVLTNFDTSNVTNMNGMFYGMSGLNSLDISSFDTSSVTDAEGMLQTFSRLILKLGGKFKGSRNMKLPGPNGNTYTGNWRNVGNGTIEEPQGNNIWSTDVFMDTYNGITDADTYVWEKVSVTARYQNTNGEKLLDDELIFGSIGTTYVTQEKKIEGYALKEIKGDATGNFTNSAKEVIYIYEGIGELSFTSVLDKLEFMDYKLSDDDSIVKIKRKNNDWSLSVMDTYPKGYRKQYQITATLLDNFKNEKGQEVSSFMYYKGSSAETEQQITKGRDIILTSPYTNTEKIKQWMWGGDYGFYLKINPSKLRAGHYGTHIQFTLNQVPV